MMENTCCVTGHRDIPYDKVSYVKMRLKEAIEEAIADGFTIFISGFAQGTDLLFADIVNELKKQQPHLFLEAALSYRGRLKTKDTLFRQYITACNGIYIHQEQYSKNCFMNCNRYMVSQSSRVIAVYDGKNNGGTLFTMRYAHTLGKQIREIRI